MKNAATLWALVKREKMANTKVVLSGAIPDAGPMARSRPMPLTPEEPLDAAPVPLAADNPRDQAPPHNPPLLPLPFFVLGRQRSFKAIKRRSRTLLILNVPATTSKWQASTLPVAAITFAAFDFGLRSLRRSAASERPTSSCDLVNLPFFRERTACRPYAADLSARHG